MQKLRTHCFSSCTSMAEDPRWSHRYHVTRGQRAFTTFASQFWTEHHTISTWLTIFGFQANLWCFSMAITVQTKLFQNLFRWDRCYVAANNLYGNTAMKMSLSVMSRDHKWNPQLPLYYFSLQSFWVCYASRVLRELHQTRLTSQLFITQTILKLSHQQTEPAPEATRHEHLFEYLPFLF